MPPRTTKLDITDHVAWGKLVKTWATGSDAYLGDASAFPFPETVEALRDQMSAGTVPPNIKSVQKLAPDDKKLILALPSKKSIEDVEDGLRSGMSYPLPQFYWNVPTQQVLWPPIAASAPIVNRLRFNHQRVGEYTVLFCA
jgi:hypothetical protein